MAQKILYYLDSLPRRRSDFSGSAGWQASCTYVCVARKKIQAEQQELPNTPQRCPKCGCDELVLHGAIRNPVEQSLHNGEPVGQRLAHDEHQVVWERLSCRRCGAECERSDERVLELQRQIEQLEFQLAFVTGRLVPENRLPC
jgi:hypothetical protein